MNSSFDSEVYSVDVGVETDSEMEWITPEMLHYERRDQPSTSAMYSSEFTSAPTEDSEVTICFCSFNNSFLSSANGVEFFKTFHCVSGNGSLYRQYCKVIHLFCFGYQKLINITV